MTARKALQVILLVSLMGVAFSGTLTYREFTGAPGIQGCSLGGAPGTLLGYPACVYGLVMYAVLAVVAGLGLRSTRQAM